MAFAFPQGANPMIRGAGRVARDLQAGNASAGSMIDEVVATGLEMAPPQYALPIQTAVGLAKQANTANQQSKGNSNKTGTKTQTKQKQSGKQKSSGKGKNTGKPEYNYTSVTEQPNRGNSAFGRVSPGTRVNLSSAMDNSTYRIPSRTQKETSAEQASKTWLQIIGITPSDINDVDANSQIAVAYESIYYHNRSSVIDKTRGGNGSTAINLTKAKWLNYIDYVMSGCAMLSEYYSLRTLNPYGDETNTVLCSIKDSINGSTSAMTSAYRLDTLISELSLPPAILDYYKFLFQTYKKSPVTGGVHQRFMSSHMAADLFEEDADFTETAAAMDSVSNFIAGNEYFPTISALMTQMTEYNWMKLDVVKCGGCEIEYDYHANAIFDNSPIHYENDGVSQRINSQLGLTVDNNSMLAAFPMDKLSVPIFVTSALLLSFGTSQTYNGFPLFKIGDSPSSTYKNNGFVLVNSTTSTNGIQFLSTYSSKRQINDTNWLINDNRDGGIFLPRGMNTQQFALTYESLSDATQELILDMFGIRR